MAWSSDAFAPAQIYNLGNTNPHTVTELVDLLERGLNRKAQRDLVPMPATGDVLATFADISAAKAVRSAATLPPQPMLGAYPAAVMM